MATPKVTPLRGGWKGLLGGIPETTQQPSGVGYGPSLDTVETEGERHERRLSLVEHEAAILHITQQISYHTKAVEQLIKDRAEHQHAIADALVPLGIRAEIAT